MHRMQVIKCESFLDQGSIFGVVLLIDHMIGRTRESARLIKIGRKYFAKVLMVLLHTTIKP